jgi:hypothetical protein
MSDEVEPPRLLIGPNVKLSDLEQEFGVCVGMMLGYGEGEFGSDGKLRWCGAMLPNDVMIRFINARRMAGQHEPFLLGMGSYGIGEALYGFALAANASYPATELLWPDQLSRPDALDDSGRFRWSNGVPLLRVWLCERVTPFAELTGVDPKFNQSHGIRVVPLDEIGPNLSVAALDVPLREVVLDRPRPLPPAIMRVITVTEGRLKYRLAGTRERDRAVVRAALLGNRLRYGQYTCEDCGYQPVADRRVPGSLARQMLEVHHIEPLAKGERITNSGDLIVLCPMCHRRTHLIQHAASHAATAVKPAALPA